MFVFSIETFYASHALDLFVDCNDFFFIFGNIFIYHL